MKYMDKFKKNIILHKYLITLNLTVLSFFVLVLLLPKNTLGSINFGKITYFIHPRYITLTMVALFVFTFLLFIYYIFLILNNYFLKKKKNNNIEESCNCDHSLYSSAFFKDALLSKTYLILFVSLLGILYPLKPLSISTFDQRISDLNNVVYSSKNTDVGFNIDTNTSQFNLLDWIKNLRENGDQLVGKDVNVEGFITLQDTDKYISRFVITCCAVDSRPIGLKISSSINSDLDSLNEGAWYSIKGVLKKEESNYYIDMSESTEIDEPENPNLY